MIDGTEDTCWSSGTPCPQHITYGPLQEKEEFYLESISLMFQGGYAGNKCEMLVQYHHDTACSEKGPHQWHSLGYFYPKDHNLLQISSFCCILFYWPLFVISLHQNLHI